MNLTELRELLTFLTFAFGAFKSTPEGRKRRAAIRLQKRIEKHRKSRLKYAKQIRKEASKKRITWATYHELLSDYDKSYPKPLT